MKVEKTGQSVRVPIKQHQLVNKAFKIGVRRQNCCLFIRNTEWLKEHYSPGACWEVGTRLTDRFLAESKKTISSAADRPSLALERSALILINACDWKQNTAGVSRTWAEAQPHQRPRAAELLPDPACQAWPEALTSPVWGAASHVEHLPVRTTKTKGYLKTKWNIGFSLVPTPGSPQDHWESLRLRLPHRSSAAAGSEPGRSSG